MSDPAPMHSGPALVLASSSPRRLQLLQEVGLSPKVVPVELEEFRLPAELPEAMAYRLAFEKASAAREEIEAGEVILGADTIVVDGDRILGKPADEAEAVDMLQELQGRSHLVITALALLGRSKAQSVVAARRTWVPMRAFDEHSIRQYVAQGSPLDKAGAYGIQDEDFQPVDMDRFEGCFTNVMGLPLCLLDHALNRLGWRPPQDLTAVCFRYHRHPLPEAEAWVGVSS